MIENQPWKPHVTVAAILEESGRFLLVEEWINDQLVINQPAGHLDEGESLLTAVVRETLEESGYQVEPDAVTGIYRWQHPDNGKTFLRVCFACHIIGYDASRALDTGIQRALWLTLEELLERKESLRSPMVLQTIQDYLAGRCFPLEIFRDLAN